MRRTWEFFSHYILVNEMAQERLDAEAETILEALLARLAQPESEWQGLTDEEANELTYASIAEIEAKLKEKNGY